MFKSITVTKMMADLFCFGRDCSISSVSCQHCRSFCAIAVRPLLMASVAREIPISAVKYALQYQVLLLKCKDTGLLCFEHSLSRVASFQAVLQIHRLISGIFVGCSKLSIHCEMAVSGIISIRKILSSMKSPGFSECCFNVENQLLYCHKPDKIPKI